MRTHGGSSHAPGLQLDSQQLLRLPNQKLLLFFYQYLELMEGLEAKAEAVQEHLRGILGVVKMLQEKDKDLGSIIRKELGGGEISGMGDREMEDEKEDEEMMV